MRKEICIGLTYGDPASVGPEILLKTLKKWKNYKFRSSPFLIGSEKYLKKNNIFRLGSPTKSTGLHAYKCLKEAVSLAKKNKIAGLVTGPVSKLYVKSAGINFSGQTDAMAKMCSMHPDDVIMLFVASELRIALFTRHIPLKSVSSKITKEKLERYLISLNNQIKKCFQIKKPKIAVLGLNPHAGENGMFGNEEIKIISPVIKKINHKGVKVFGPLSPDATLATAGNDFLLGKKQKYDVYVSFYHDQALPMFKAIAGMQGVNVTLGLPFIRVSPDHGTAFDIAGKNKASNEGLVSAIRLLEQILR